MISACLSDIFSWLDQHSGSVTAIATMTLVVITGYYAVVTHKIHKVMSRQVTADITLTDIEICSPFLSDKFRQLCAVGSIPEGEHLYLNFKLLFTAYNKNSGSGSISKPSIIIKSEKSDLSLEYPPITKRWEPPMHRGSLLGQTQIDLGKVIYFQGGELKIIELNYASSLSDNKQFERIKESVDSFQYYIKYTDNLGGTFRRRITCVKGMDEFPQP